MYNSYLLCLFLLLFTMYYFLYFLLLSKETHQFYNTALSILTQDNIYVNLDNVKPEDTDFLLYKNELNTADTYLETQQLGNCTYRSSYLGTIVYMVLINGFSINNFEDWIIVLKLSLIKGYLEFYLDTLQTKTDNHEYDLMYSYVVNSYSEIYLKIHSTNPKFNVWGIGVEPSKIEILTEVDGLQFNESYKKRKYFTIDKLQIPYIEFEDLIKNKLASGRYKDLADIEQLIKNRE